MGRDNGEIFMFKNQTFLWQRMNIAKSDESWPIFMYETLFIHTKTKKKRQVYEYDIWIIPLRFERTAILLYHTTTSK